MFFALIKSETFKFSPYLILIAFLVLTKKLLVIFFGGKLLIIIIPAETNFV